MQKIWKPCRDQRDATKNYIHPSYCNPIEILIRAWRRTDANIKIDYDKDFQVFLIEGKLHSREPPDRTFITNEEIKISKKNDFSTLIFLIHSAVIRNTSMREFNCVWKCYEISFVQYKINWYVLVILQEIVHFLLCIELGCCLVPELFYFCYTLLIATVPPGNRIKGLNQCADMQKVTKHI